MPGGRDQLDFINVGTPRSGTTWLYKCLAEHPDICIPKEKDLFFWNYNKHPFYKRNKINYQRGITWYLSHFSTCKLDQIRGEIGTLYLIDSHAAERIKMHFPEVKIIITLRDPVERLYSEYLKGKHKYILPSFEEAVRDKTFWESSNYYPYVRKYMELFPPEHIFILFHCDIKNRPSFVMEQLYSFLGARVDFKPSALNTTINTSAHSLAYNKILRWTSVLRKSPLLGHLTKIRPVKRIGYTGVDVATKLAPKNIPELNSQTKAGIRETYRESVENLEQLLYKDLSFWKH